MPHIIPLPHHTAAGDRAPVAADRLVRGAPSHATTNVYSDPSGVFHCGVWEGDAGAWRVHYTEHECCHMLAGRVRIVGDDGSERVVAAGDSFVIPAGFSGLWEVLEPARKVYAVYEPPSA